MHTEYYIQGYHANVTFQNVIGGSNIINQPKIETYYRATALPRTTSSALTNHEHAQVCVIGAGFAGLSAAKGLAERGIDDVVVLEAEEIGHGCSGRNGGFVFSGFNLDEADLINQVGLEHAKTLYLHSETAVNMVRNNIDNFQIECEVNNSGIMLANWFDRPEILRNYKTLMAEAFDVTLGEYGLDECRSLLKSKRYYGALHEHGAFHFHPLKYIHGLADGIKSRGVRIYENSPVIRLSRTKGGMHIVDTPNGAITAKMIIMAGSAYM